MPSASPQVLSILTDGMSSCRPSLCYKLVPNTIYSTNDDLGSSCPLLWAHIAVHSVRGRPTRPPMPLTKLKAAITCSVFRESFLPPSVLSLETSPYNVSWRSTQDTDVPDTGSDHPHTSSRTSRLAWWKKTNPHQANAGGDGGTTYGSAMPTMQGMLLSDISCSETLTNGVVAGLLNGYQVCERS